jgi:CheY-like chemotaxis protein
MAQKILVCDDDEGVLEVMQIILNENGFDVKTLNNGRGIIKKVKEIKPDLIFLDIWMPGIDGKEVTKLLKNDPATSSIPIILVSALNTISDIQKEISADGYLSKPFDLDVLVNTVKKHTS